MFHKCKLAYRTFGVNFKPTIHVSQAMVAGLKKMGATKGSSIVNVTSIVGSKTCSVVNRMPIKNSLQGVDHIAPNFGLYSCTKGAISSLTKVMALELGPLGIRVNEVRPNGMDTGILEKELACPEKKKFFDTVLERNQNRQVRPGTLPVEQMADVILYLSTEDGEFVTGSDVKVDAGFCIT